MEMARANVIIMGKVQGVFFRDSTRAKAQELGVTGWVRNLPLRKVEAVFEGPADKVGQLIDWCRQGPPAANVTDLRVSWQDYAGEFDSFTVRR